MILHGQYEDPVRQEAARKSVPVDELEEKALVALAKVHFFVILLHLLQFVLVEFKFIVASKLKINHLVLTLDQNNPANFGENS